LILGEATDAEPHIAELEARGGAAAVSRAADPGVAAPRAAAQQPSSYIISVVSPRATICWCSVIVVMPVISAPLPHVAMHVVQPPGIGGEAAGVGGLFAINPFLTLTIGVISIVICQLRADRFAKVERSGGASSASIFPLCLAR
jgi:hypothetical protein